MEQIGFARVNSTLYCGHETTWAVHSANQEQRLGARSCVRKAGRAGVGGRRAGQERCAGGSILMLTGSLPITIPTQAPTAVQPFHSREKKIGKTAPAADTLSTSPMKL